MTRHAERCRSNSAQGFEASFWLAEGKRIYGLGDNERFRIQHREHRVEMWIENVNRYAPILYLMSSRNWAIFINTTWKHEFDIGHTERDNMQNC